MDKASKLKSAGDIFGRVRGLASRVFGVTPEVITPASCQETMTTWDSLAHLSLVMELENEFGITFSTEEIIPMTSIEQVCKTVKRHLDET